MALISLGAVVSNISGSIGGATFARNRGGAYARNRTVPLNPKSQFQNPLRSTLGGLAQAWSQELTDTQRRQWDNYAAAVPVINRLGDERQLSGINMFIRANTLLLQMGADRRDAGPDANVGGTGTGLTVTINPTTQKFSVTQLGKWVTLPAEGVGLLVQFSPPQNAGVNFFASPFRTGYAGVITDLQALPTDQDLPFPVTQGLVVFVRHRYVSIDGRVGVAQVQRFPVA